MDRAYYLNELLDRKERQQRNVPQMHQSFVRYLRLRLLSS